MKKAFIITAVILAVSLCVSAGVVLFGGDYHQALRLNITGEPRTAGVRYETNNGNAAVTACQWDGEVLTFTLKAVSPGRDGVLFSDGAGNYLEYEDVLVSPLGTVYSTNRGFDFANSHVVFLILTFDAVLVTAVMLTAFFVYRRQARFGYGMIICGGIGIFFLLFLAVTALFFVSSGGWENMTLGYFLSTASSAVIFFATLTVPVMLLFSLAVAVSNIALIRHEGFRVQNLLGVIFGFVWFVGVQVLFFAEQIGAAGSSQYVRVSGAVTNVIALVISYFVCMLMATVAAAWLSTRHKPPFDRDCIAILGCAIRSDGTLTPLLRGRADSALAFEQAQFKSTGRHACFVPSGGQGSDEIISESEAMKRYLMENGVPEERIWCEDKSVNTYQNMQFSKRVMDGHGGCRPAFATTNYHVFRGYVLAQKVGMQDAQGISAKTKWYFYPNAFLRELVGLIVDKKWKHIIFLTLLSAAEFGLSYLSFIG